MVFDSALFYQQRSDLRAIDRDIQLTFLKQETEKQNLRPQFGVRFDNMYGFGGQPMQYTVMGMVKIPMAKWSSKMYKANIESLKWKANALQSQKQMMANELSGMAYGMRNELELKKSAKIVRGRDYTRLEKQLQNHAACIRTEYRRVVYAL